MVALLAAVSLPAAALGAISRSPTERVLAQLRSSGTLSRGDYAADVSTYRRAARPKASLGVSQRTLLRAVAADSDGLARRGLFAARRTQVMRTLQANLATLGAGQPLGAFGARRTIGGSRVIWQFYPASGWQVQPLGNWGEVHRLLGTKRTTPQAAALADDLLSWAVPRGGGLAFEYLFPWNGAPAGWMSAMPTASAMKALAIITDRTGDEHYANAARRLGALLEKPPPTGVALRRGAGRVHLLLYSQSPGALVGNGFASALNSLFDYVKLTGDARMKRVLDDGEAEADATLQRYDTGAWSRYQVGPSGAGAESDLHYHQLFTEFLRGLCKRLDRDPYCSLAERFKAYEAEPVRLGTPSVSSGARSTVVRFWASKVGTAKVSAWRGGTLARAVTVRVTRGTARVTLAAGRADRVKIEATSLNGRTSSVER